jgi:hypothetical protein
MIMNDQVEDELDQKDQQSEDQWEKLRAEREVTVKIIAPVRDLLILGDQN